jgi:hypothetical protein
MAERASLQAVIHRCLGDYASGHHLSPRQWQVCAHIGEPTEPPPIAPARGPPAWDNDLGPMPERDLLGQPEPDIEFDQRVSW